MSEPSERDSGALRTRARELIEQGRLPRSRAVRTWGGRGSGSRCDLCDTPIASDEPEFELQLDLTPSAEPVRLHRLCHSLWSEAREECEPSGWRPVSRELPPPGVVVEARVSLGGGRSIILSVICLSWPQQKVESGSDDESSAAAPAWLNATTRGPLPDGWLPLEWRPAPGASAAPGSDVASSSDSTAPSSDPSAGAAA